MASNTGDAQTKEAQDDGRIRRPGMAVDLYRVYLRLRRTWYVVAGALALSVVAGVMYVKTNFKPVFVSTINVKYSPPAEGGDKFAELAWAESALFSEESLEMIKEKTESPLPAWILGKTFTAAPNFMTATLEIEASGYTGKEAADRANAVAATLTEMRVTQAQSSARTELDEVEARIKATREKLATDRAAYDAFREEYGIADLTSEQESTITAAATARAEADAAKARKITAERRLAALESGSAPPSSAPSGESSLELRRARLELASLRTRMTEEHPQIVALRDRIRELEARGGGGRNSGAISRARADVAAAERALAPLEEAARVARERADAFSEVEGEATTLLGAVRLGEANLELLNRQRGQLESEAVSGTSDFSRVAPAMVPSFPESNNMKLVFLAAFPAVTMFLVLGLLVIFELRGFKVETASELAFWGGGPVIGATAWPDDPHGLEALVADLDDRLPNATGTMLIVPSREAEVPLAEEFTSMLNEDWFSPSLVDLGGVGNLEAGQAADMTGGYPALASGNGGGGAAIVPAQSFSPSTSVRGAMVDTTGAFQTQQPSVGVSTWTGPPTSQALRRSARLADRVLILATAGETSFAEAAATSTRLGRTDGVGFLLINVKTDFRGLPDRVGAIDDFWSASRS